MLPKWVPSPTLPAPHLCGGLSFGLHTPSFCQRLEKSQTNSPLKRHCRSWFIVACREGKPEEARARTEVTVVTAGDYSCLFTISLNRPGCWTIRQDLSGTGRNSPVSMNVPKAPGPALPSRCPPERCWLQHRLGRLPLRQAPRSSHCGGGGSTKPQGVGSAPSCVSDRRKPRELKRNNVNLSSIDKYHPVLICLARRWDRGDD